MSRRGHCRGVDVADLVGNIINVMVALFTDGRLPSAQLQPLPPPSPLPPVVRAAATIPRTRVLGIVAAALTTKVKNKGSVNFV